MNTFICGDVECLLHESGIIDRFVDLKAVFFLDSPLYSIPLAINVCDIRFPNENVVIDGYLSILRLSTWMNKLSVKTDFKEIDNVFFVL